MFSCQADPCGRQAVIRARWACNGKINEADLCQQHLDSLWERLGQLMNTGLIDAWCSFGEPNGQEAIQGTCKSL